MISIHLIRMKLKNLIKAVLYKCVCVHMGIRCTYLIDEDVQMYTNNIYSTFNNYLSNEY